MAPSRRFDISYAPAVRAHLKSIERKYHSLIRHAIEEMLQFEPGVETTNRKPLWRPDATDEEWEIRFGPDNRFRVFYEIDWERRCISILAIGVKLGNRLYVGGEEVRL